jgi:hypothetical protein
LRDVGFDGCRSERRPANMKVIGEEWVRHEV